MTINEQRRTLDFFFDLFSGILLPKASYSRSSTTSASQQDLLESYPYRINGKNGSSSSLFLKNVNILDAVDDEYEGVVVNPKRLPSNPNVFESALRSSMYHWKLRVSYPLFGFTANFK